MSDQIVYLPLGDLNVHPAVKGLPYLPEAQFKALVESIREHGILQPLMVAVDEVVDGRDRLKAARRLQLTEVPCILKPADQVVTLSLNSLVRKHYEPGARAYLATPLLEQALAETTARQIANLKKGAKSPSVGKPTLGERVTPTEALAGQLGISRDTLFQARKVAKLFAAQDNVIDAWLDRSPEAAGLWAEWDQEQPGAWTAFAAHWRKKAGLIELDGDLLPPENFRERWEPELFEGEIGLGGIIQAISGLVSTKGKTRGDKVDGEEAAYLAAMRRIERFNTEAFARWSDLPPDVRVPLIQKLTGSLPDWPDDVRRAVHAHLKALYGK